jgi:small subunit ribosomal protein S7e
MHTARRKIQKDKGVEPSEFEDSVAQVSAEPYFAAFVIVSSLNSSVFFSLNCSEQKYKCPYVIVIALVATLQAFFDLENSNTELKSDLKDLYINNAV